MSQVCQNVPYNVQVVFTQRVPSVGISVITEMLPAVETVTVVSCVPVAPDNASMTSSQGGQPRPCTMTTYEKVESKPGQLFFSHSNPGDLVC